MPRLPAVRVPILCCTKACCLGLTRGQAAMIPSRYNRNASWVVAAPESPQLLAVCMKKVSGLQRVRLVNAEFLWTEPHSKRLKVTITVQKEVCACVSAESMSCPRRGCVLTTIVAVHRS